MSNQTPYIGSKISLISKLDIRYEGILYTVDTNDSTIALAKVQSFGTEDRPTTNPVSARDDVYEYIIFKASDIKDLIVCETPKAAPLNQGLPYDPAIISVSSRSSGGAPVPPGAEQQASAGSSRSTTPRGAAPNQRAPGAPGSNRGGQPPNVGTTRGGRGRGGFSHPPNEQRSGPSPSRGGFHNYPPRGGFNAQRGRNPGNYGVPRANPREKLKFDSDYDFEKANEQYLDVLAGMFQGKMKLEDKSEEEEVPAAGVAAPAAPEVTEEPGADFYDKKSSFFDRISCEALEKAEGKNGRPDWRKERETNQETFGHSAVRSLNYRRGFGMRGRGGNRGYGGQGYNSYHRGGGGGGYSGGYNNGGGYRQNNNGYSNNGGNNSYHHRGGRNNYNNQPRDGGYAQNQAAQANQ